MSQENVELVRAAFDAWNRGDHDALLEMWDEEAEFYPLRAQLESRSYHGHDGLRPCSSARADQTDVLPRRGRSPGPVARMLEEG